MCLPVKFLKFVVESNAFLTIIVGMLALITGIVMGIKTVDLNQTFFESIQQSTKNQNVLYIFGSVTIILGVIGWYGGKKKNTYLLAVFNLANFIFLWIFIYISLSALLSTDVFDLNNGSCKDTVQSFVAQGASDTFCKEECKCYIDTNKFDQGYFNNLNLTYTTRVIEYNGCPTFKTLNSSQTNERYYQFLKVAETFFGCAGWCQVSPIYQFSDVNRGRPKSNMTCYFEVSNWVYNYGQTIGSICFTIASILFLTLVFTCCLCFHPDKQDQPNLYKRMAYYED